MKLRKWLENWDLTKLKVNAFFLEVEWEPQEKDREAAWELYVEMITRVLTQPLVGQAGEEIRALESAHDLFAITREILRKNGRECIQFTKIAVVVLNQIVRPFTGKWHPLSVAGHFQSTAGRTEFRSDLAELQTDLRNYSRLLAAVAQVEDLTTLSER